MASSFFYAFFSLFTFFTFPCTVTVTALQPFSLKTCQTLLVYRTQPPYNTFTSIASLFSANASQISAMNNNIGENAMLATNTEVIIPVTLSSCVNTKKKWEYFWKGVAVGVAVVLVLGVMLLCILRRIFRRFGSSQSFEKSLENQKDQVLDNILKQTSLKVYYLKDMQPATEIFSSDTADKANLHSI